MPCRALEAFRQIRREMGESNCPYVLMPCRALEAFRRKGWVHQEGGIYAMCLNALSGIGGVQTEKIRVSPHYRQFAS